MQKARVPASGLLALRPVEELGDELPYSFGFVFLEEVAAVWEGGELGEGVVALDALHGFGDVGERAVVFAVDEDDGVLVARRAGSMGPCGGRIGHDAAGATTGPRALSRARWLLGLPQRLEGISLFFESTQDAVVGGLVERRGAAENP